MVGELSAALDGRAESLRQLALAGDVVTSALAARTEALERLAVNGTRVTRAFAAHQGSLGAALTDLREISESLRNAKGDTAVLLTRGRQLVDQLGSLIANHKAELDCDLKVLELIVDRTSTPVKRCRAAGTRALRAAGVRRGVGCTRRRGRRGLGAGRVPRQPRREPPGAVLTSPYAAACACVRPVHLAPQAVSDQLPDGLARRWRQPRHRQRAAGRRHRHPGRRLRPRRRAQRPASRGVSDTGDEQPHPSPAQPVGGSVRRWQLAVAFLLALSIGLGFLTAIQSSNVNRERDREAAVRRVAAAMGTALLSYDYTHLEKGKQDVLRLATGTFRRQYNEAFTGGLDELLKETKATSQVREAEVLLGEVGEDGATAIVILDTIVSGTAGTNRSLVSYVRLDLVRTGERWLVNAVTNLNLGQPTGGTGAPAATTTTAAP